MNYELEMQELFKDSKIDSPSFDLESRVINKSHNELKDDVIRKLTEANRKIIKRITEQYKSEYIKVENNIKKWK